MTVWRHKLFFMNVYYAKGQLAIRNFLTYLKTLLYWCSVWYRIFNIVCVLQT